MVQIVRTSVGRYVNRIVKNEKGVTAIEYGLIAALLAIVLIGSLNFASESLQAVFNDVAQKLTDAIAS